MHNCQRVLLSRVYLLRVLHHEGETPSNITHKRCDDITKSGTENCHCHSQTTAAQTQMRRTIHIFGSIRPLFEDIRPSTSGCVPHPCLHAMRQRYTPLTCASDFTLVITGLIFLLRCAHAQSIITTEIDAGGDQKHKIVEVAIRPVQRILRNLNRKPKHAHAS